MESQVANKAIFLDSFTKSTTLTTLPDPISQNSTTYAQLLAKDEVLRDLWEKYP